MFRNPGQGATQQDGAARPRLVLATVALVAFLVTFDLSLVNVGLPRVATGLGFSAVGMTWIINAYTLTFGGLMLLAGKAADQYGRRRMLMLGAGLFGLASLAGGLAQDPGQLVVARAVQGVGAAAMSPAALALLTATFPSGRRRVRAFGIWSAMNGTGGAVGVLVGGVLTQYASWRAVLLVNVPMVAVMLALICRGAGPDRAVPRERRMDWLGGVLVTAGLSLLVFGLVRTDRYGWLSATTAATLTAATALLIGFVQIERSTSREPLVRLRLLANRMIAGSNGFNLLVGAAMPSAFYFVSLYLQRVLGVAPALTGVEFLPFALGVITGSMLAIRLGYRFAPRTLLICGSLITAAGLSWFALISPDGSFATDVLGPSIVASAGFGLCLGPVVSLATAGVPPADAGIASALLSSSRQIGGSIGLAALGVAAQHRITRAPRPASIAALDRGYALGLGLSAALLVAAALLAATVLRTSSTRNGRRRRGPSPTDGDVEPTLMDVGAASRRICPPSTASSDDIRTDSFLVGSGLNRPLPTSHARTARDQGAKKSMNAPQTALTEDTFEPGDAQYDAATRMFFTTAAPSQVITPRDPQGVAAALRHAARRGEAVTARCGGHDPLEHGHERPGTIIDLKRLNRVEVLDRTRRLVRVGGGSTWGQVATVLDRYGWALTAGDTADVGVGGLTLGGGVGWMVRRYGLAIDNLVGARVVTADGRTLIASAQEHPDLFWALRGGGGNFGVVVDFDFIAQPVSTVHFGAVTYQGDDPATLMTRWRDVMRQAPDELSSTLVLPPRAAGSPPTLTTLFCYADDPQTASTKAANAIQPLLELGTTISKRVSQCRYAEILEPAGSPPPFRVVPRNVLVDSLDRVIIEKVCALHGRRTPMAIAIRSLGGAFGRVPSDATAFAHRSAEAMVVALMMPAATPTEPEVPTTVAEWDALAALGAGIYINFQGSSTASDLASAYPAQTHRRLAQIKHRYDPENRFAHNHNIKPSAR